MKSNEPYQEKYFFHHDNAPAHTSTVAMATILDCGFEIVSQPSYSTDLATSDFHLFPNMKNALAGQRFANDNEAMDAVKCSLGPRKRVLFKWYKGTPASMEQMQFSRWRLCEK